MNAPAHPLDPAVRQDPQAFLRRLFDAAVAAAQPQRVLPAFLPAPPKGRTVVIGAGKASAAMALTVERHWPADAPIGGVVVTRYGHIPPHEGTTRIEMVEASHPVPDAAGERAAQRIVDAVQGLGDDDLVLCLISGGGSALLAQPLDGLTLADKQALNRALLHSGASIDEMNCVRKHLSAVKGGRLGAMCAPAQVVTLLISDVPGDAPEVIASGPTVPDPTTCADALAILAHYRIEVPPAVRDGLTSGRFETPKPGDPRFDGHVVHMIATPRQSLHAAAELARAAGLPAHVLGDAIEGESREVGRVHAAMAQYVSRHGEPFAAPCVLLSGGETTVTVKGSGGRGGRAGEFALGCAVALHGDAHIHGLAADTDGIDGTEANAGARFGPDTLERARAAGLDARQQLERNDAFSLFESLGDLVVTGPTHTNVNDFRALLVLPRDSG